MDDWRRIDIDALEPENHLCMLDLIPKVDSISHDEVVAVGLSVKQKLSQGQFAEALKAVLDMPPYVSDERTKSLHTETVFEVLASIKNNHNISEYASFVLQLTTEQQDTLIKYIYKIMGTSFGAKHGALMLGWFEKTVDVTGMGPVARFFSDRRTV